MRLIIGKLANKILCNNSYVLEKYLSSLRIISLIVTFVLCNWTDFTDIDWQINFTTNQLSDKSTPNHNPDTQRKCKRKRKN